MVDLTKVQTYIHMRDSCDSPLPINTNDIPPIRIFRCYNDSNCIEQSCIVELQMKDDYNMVIVTHRALVV